MFNIIRTIEGKEYQIELTEDELKEIQRQDKIRFAKDVLPNYSELLVDYNSIIKDENKLVQFTDMLEDKCIENNGEIEIEVIEKLFKIKE